MKFESLVFAIYDSVWRGLLTIARIFQNHLPWKLQRYLIERQIPHMTWRRSPHSHLRRIWFHAASGELEYIKPVLRLWKERHPEDLLFVSYFSTSARSLIAATPEIDGWAPLPCDLPELCERWLQELNPAILVISRTDLWPTILKSLSPRPRLLVASTWAEGSKKTRGLGRWMSRWCLHYLDQVSVVAPADAESLKSLAPFTSPLVTGDPRFDQVEFRLQQKRELPTALTAWADSASLLVAGSTWEEDEKALLPAWKKSPSGKQKMLIVPHETTSDHLQKLRREFERLEIPYTFWSEFLRSGATRIETLVLVFDQKGWLADLYRLGQVAFVGGSFKKQVHSVMEALGCGLPVLVGPYYKNNREALEFAQKSAQGIPFVEPCSDPATLAQSLQKHWQHSETQASMLKKTIRETFLGYCGASEKTYEEIKQCLLSRSSSVPFTKKP